MVLDGVFANNTALIGYIHYEAPEEEQNFSTLLEMINAMEVREYDEEQDF